MRGQIRPFKKFSRANLRKHDFDTPAGGGLRYCYPLFRAPAPAARLESQVIIFSLKSSRDGLYVCGSRGAHKGSVIRVRVCVKPEKNAAG